MNIIEHEESPIIESDISPLDAILKAGALRLLEQAVQSEVSAYISAHSHQVDEHGHRLVVRNGHHPERTIATGVGSLPIKQPRVNDRRMGCKFSSNILPKYLRRAPSIDALIPALYLHGVSTGDFEEALEAILGPQAAGLSANTIVRLKKCWEDEYDQWQRRDLAGKEYAYIWVDGIYFNVRLTADRPCILVIIGATPEGNKEIIAVHDGERESKLSWTEILEDLKRRGLSRPPKVAVGDGALGFWSAIEEVWPTTEKQRCWVHKTANLLNCLPKSLHSEAKRLIHEMYMSPTRKAALKAYDQFLRVYGAKYPKARANLEKDKKALFAFYDFPAEHWIHLRTTNPIESTFATVRHRTKRTKGCGSRKATMSMVYKLAIEAQKHWRKLNKHQLVLEVIKGTKFTDGEIQKAA
jgi:transposase-like protein